MRALVSRRLTDRVRLNTRSARTSTATPSLPVMRTRRPATAAATGLYQPRAHYYFDAGQQTAKTFRVLLSKQNATAEPLGQQAAPRLLAEAMESLLYSIRPGLDDDGESRAYFLSLLEMHLNRLHATEIDQLIASLNSLQFACYITESVVDDVMKLEYGFTNGPPHCQTRTLLQTNELFTLLDALRHQTTPARVTMISAAQVDAARLALADCALVCAQSTTPSLCLTILGDAAQALAAALTMPVPWHSVVAAPPASGAAMLDQYENQLRIDPSIMTALPPERSEIRFAAILRDLLELLLAQKLFGTDPPSLTHQQRYALQDVLDQISATPPSIYPAALRDQARALMSRRDSFGQVQIMPTTGVALGHAWLAPVLSLVPDKTQAATEIGRRFLQSGFQLTPSDCVIRQWPSRFLNAIDNENLYPTRSAWHLTVPADQIRLREEAENLRREWREHGIPYRFIGVAPAREASGCRITVWQAVQRAMDADARALFAHYNRGLPEPDSPTELWLRLDGLMRWIAALSLLK